ncbi:hypothetical protein JYU34_010356 [Plutella xylostella]|uniref:Uncharacterized protein n=2 Tax=Plutella xylostella TaxID=51655 RepID=A0ABQ7QIC7_PLUXY|nr:hypothetical protein JYU34_010356 [Plutella xylostella]CAG9130458.1 unnamed protein product [Plutella xylostella]
MSQRKNTSEIWDYFEKVERDGKAVCKTCRESYSFKTTTANLKNHLKRKHDSLQEFKDSLAKVKRIRSWLFPQKYFCYRKTEPGADIERQNTETSDPRSRN